MPLLLPNKYSGYIYLLDRDNHIRWRGCGFATLDELEVLVEATRQLLGQQEKEEREEEEKEREREKKGEREREREEGREREKGKEGDSII